MQFKSSFHKFLGFFTRDRSLRIGVFFIVLAVLFWGKNNLSDEAHIDSTNAIIDKLFEATQSVNDLMNSSEAWINFFEISSSWCIDLIFFGMFLSWIYIGDSFRLILAYALFYGIRAGVQAMCVLPYPPGMIWVFPVAPSFTVPFGVTSDFMPSGHVGFCTIAAAEFYKRKWYVAMVLAWIVGLYECFVMLSARGHYSIDLFFGIIMAHYMHSWAHSLCTGWWVFSIDKVVGPYLLYKWDVNPLNDQAMTLPTTAAPVVASNLPPPKPTGKVSAKMYTPVSGPDAMSPETPGHNASSSGGGAIELHPFSTSSNAGPANLPPV